MKRILYWINPINLIKTWFTYEPAPYEVIKSDDPQTVINRCANDPRYGPHVIPPSPWEQIKNLTAEDWGLAAKIFFGGLLIVWLHFVFTNTP